MKRHTKLSLTTRLVLTFGLLMLAANILLGLVILSQSTAAMRTLIDKNMLDVTQSAAELIDGETLNGLSEADVGGETYAAISKTLLAFQNNDDIRFIYIVRPEAADRFVFIVDPDPVEPADFGEEIVLTGGLIKAGAGVPAVDEAPMADRWGNFYSAYSPIFDDAGQVAGIVGIDFDAEWYDAQVRKYTLSISVITALSLLIAGLAVFLITNSVRRKFKELDADLSALSSNVDELMAEVVSISGYAPRSPDADAEDASDELEVLGQKIHEMQRDMLVYLDYMHTQAHIDALTQVHNSTAYHGELDLLDKRIQQGDVDFHVAVFDINSLKEINDNIGHPCGDFIIRGAADIIARAFGPERTFRIGGDEFSVIAERMTAAEMQRHMDAIAEGIRAFNASPKPYDVTLAVSMGCARFNPETDVAFREVFARADELMYAAKRQYYETTGNRRRAR